MPSSQPDLWGAGDAYERYMGRWSRKVAPLFTDWIGAPPGAEWIDVGCGTGVLTSAILSRSEPSRVVGIDSSAAFLQTAQDQVADSRASFRPGDAQALPEGDGAFDTAVSGLVLNFIPDKNAAVQEMVRVVKPGGAVVLFGLGYARAMQVMRSFFHPPNAPDP